MKLKKLLEKFKIKNISPAKDIDIKKLTRFSEEADEECIFFDIPGARGEEKNYEFKKIPPVIITENPKKFKKTKSEVIEVKNARDFYSMSYSAFLEIDYTNLKIIGITGTNGKTSTATMVKHILEFCGIKTGFIGTGKIEIGAQRITEENYSMTTPDPEILYPAIKRMEESNCRAIVMEISSHALVLNKVNPIPFEICIFTGLSSEHMDFHKDMNDYFSAKEKLIELSKKAIINNDDKYGRLLVEKHKDKAITCGIIFGGDYRITDIERMGFSGSKYILRTNSFLTPIALPISADHNIYNSALASSALITIGIKPCECKEALKSMHSIEGRMEITDGTVQIIKDYAHTPFALENLLKTVKRCKNPRQNITVVFGCGGERDSEKRPKMAKIASQYANKVIITNDNPRGESVGDILADIIAGINTESFGIIADRRLAIKYAIENASDGDIVVIAGKGHEKYICDEFGYTYFDEDLIIKEALAKR